MLIFGCMIALNLIKFQESKCSMSKDEKIVDSIRVFERKLNVWEANHLEDCKNKKLQLFENKHILEIGGVTPYSETSIYNVKSWTCIALNAMQEVNIDKYAVIKANIETYKFKEAFYDTCITTNCFEHVSDVKKGLLNIYKAMKPGGFISILYGPIWSSHFGHHLYIADLETKKYYTFNDGIIPPWGHLLYEEKDLKSYLIEQKYSERITNLIVGQVYHSNLINRFFYEDYIDIFNYVFNAVNLKVQEYKNWHNPVYPDKELQKKLSQKYNKNEFGVISSKWLLQKDN